MTAERRSEGLAAAARVARAELLALAEETAEKAEVEMIDAPAAGSVMLELHGSVGAFCLSEVIVTTARLRCDGVEGFGCVLGLDQEGALAGALLDARDDAPVRQLVDHALAAEDEERRRISRRIAATRV